MCADSSHLMHLGELKMKTNKIKNTIMVAVLCALLLLGIYLYAKMVYDCESRGGVMVKDYADFPVCITR